MLQFGVEPRTDAVWIDQSKLHRRSAIEKHDLARIFYPSIELYCLSISQLGLGILEGESGKRDIGSSG